jgi:hypothetical protein
MTQKEKLAEEWVNVCDSDRPRYDSYLAGYNECEKTMQIRIAELESRIADLETERFELLNNPNHGIR